MVYIAGHKAIILSDKVLSAPADQGEAIAKTGEALAQVAKDILNIIDNDPRREMKPVIKALEPRDIEAKIRKQEREAHKQPIAAPKAPSVKAKS